MIAVRNCGHCHGSHDTLDQAKACAALFYADRNRSFRVVSGQPTVPATSRSTAPRPTFASLAAQIDFPDKGTLHFALPSQRHPDRPFLFVVVKGRVPGRVFVNRITAQGGTKLDVETKDQLWALQRLVADQPAAEQLYAKSTDHCSRCDKFLSDQTSIDRGYGPKCWAKIQSRGAA